MRGGRGLPAVAGAIAVLVGVPADASADRGGLAHPAVVGEYVVTFAPDVNGEGRMRALRDRGAHAVDRIPALDATVVRFGNDAAAQAARMVADRRFAIVEPNFLYHAVGEPNDPDFGAQWAYPKIVAPPAWEKTPGSSTTVIAVVDTGVEKTHPDLDAKIVPGYDYVQGDGAPDDENGHGTHVAGIAAAETGNGTGGAGTCPRCSIMPVRVLDERGSGTMADVANGITWAANKGAHVINLSLVGPKTSSVGNAVNQAVGKGALLACAAGNEGTSAPSRPYPAEHPGCVAVASTTKDDVRSWFSNYGSWVDIAAPGSDIRSTWRRGGYKTLSGTSMAAPHVAGVAGLLRSQGLTAQQAKERMCLSAAGDGGTGEWAWGRINAGQAVNPDSDAELKKQSICPKADANSGQQSGTGSEPNDPAKTLNGIITGLLSPPPS